MHDTHFLYKITKNEKELYIGVSIDPETRFLQHIRGRGCPELLECNEASLEIIAQGTKEEIYNKEIELIETLKPSLNKANGGCGGNTGNYALGEEHPNSKLTEDQVVLIRHRLGEGEKVRDLAEEYQVNYSCIHKIWTGKSWGHVGGPIKRSKEELIQLAKKLKRKKFSYKKIAETLGIHPHTAKSYVVK